MTAKAQAQLGGALWKVANQLRGAMDADDFRDYMLSFLFLYYVSHMYEEAVEKELGADYPQSDEEQVPLAIWYAQNEGSIERLEKQMRRKMHYVIKPQYLWSNISKMAARQDTDLLTTLRKGFKDIEEHSFERAFQGLFSEISLDSEKLGKTSTERNSKLCDVVSTIAEELTHFLPDRDHSGDEYRDHLGDAYEYLLSQFAAGSGKKAGEFYTPQYISTILSKIVVLDSQNPAAGRKKKIHAILDFACGSGSLLLNVRRQLGEDAIGQIYGQEKNITTYNLARMNMLLHKVKDSDFAIHHGDSLLNDWELFGERNPREKIACDAVVANPPFSYRWQPTAEMKEDFRFHGYGVAPKSAADFAFLLHGFHFLSDEGVMAIILPHGVLFRGGSEGTIRTKLLEKNYIDTVIGLPPKLFFSTGIPVCILVLKKCKKFDDVLFINASQHFEKGKRQNALLDEHIEHIVDVYRERTEERRYSKRVSLETIKNNGDNLNISRYVSSAEPEEPIALGQVHAELVEARNAAQSAKERHNAFLDELGVAPLP